MDDRILPEETAGKLMPEDSKLGFMIHNLWKEWRKL